MALLSRYLDPVLVEQLNQLQVSARQVVEGSISGQHRSPIKGASVEFRQHRFYTVGDEPRRIDWRVLARTDRPYVKEYDEETNLRCAMLLDCSGSMAYAGTRPVVGRMQGMPENKFTRGAGLVAALSYLMLGQTEAVGLGLLSARLDHWMPPAGGSAQLPRVMSILDRAAPHGRAKLEAAIHQAAERIERRALVMILSDFIAPLSHIRRALARLRHDRHEVILLRILHPDETTFPFSHWTRFRGLEGESPHLCEPARVRRIYLDNFQRHEKGLSDACRAAGAEYYSFLTSQSLIQTVTTFLRRRVPGR